MKKNQTLWYAVGFVYLFGALMAQRKGYEDPFTGGGFRYLGALVRGREDMDPERTLYRDAQKLAKSGTLQAGKGPRSAAGMTSIPPITYGGGS